MAIDTDKLNEFLGKFVGDLGATVAAGSVVIGHRLGLCKALAAAPATAGELAAQTGTSPRYVAKWLLGQEAGDHHRNDGTRPTQKSSAHEFVIADRLPALNRETNRGHTQHPLASRPS